MDLASELRRATTSRSRALGDRISTLRGTLSDDRLALAEVLDLFGHYPDALDFVVEAEWQRNTSDTSRIQILRPLLRHTIDVTTFVDDWLGHTGTPAVPLYLLKAVERACDAVGIGPRRAVIASGPADNFTTVVGDLHHVVFSSLGPLCPTVPSPKNNFALMRAPRLEGTTALWHPILLGHELAHIAVQVHGALAALDFGQSFDFAQATALGSLVPGAGGAGLPGALRLFEIGEMWVVELLCDALAIRSFGLGAVAALGEYLETIGATDKASETHPPGRLRNQLLVAWLGSLSDARLDAVAGPWRELSREPLVFAEPWVQFLVDTIMVRRADIFSVVQAWPGQGYDTNLRSPAIHAVASALASGRPTDVAVPVKDAITAVLDADIVNAAWLGRVEQVTAPVDALALKSLDNLEFMRQWGEAGGSWPILPTPGNAIASESATLSYEELLNRIVTSSGERLVVTPLLPEAASGASLDLRLGNSFIVFVRSRTASFNPLDGEQDPRRVQRSMQLSWGDTFVLHPAELVLAATLEYLVLPGDLSAQVVSRSSYGRLGLLSATAVQVHPHFHGCLTLELVNLGTVPLVLTPGERIAQLVVSPVSYTPPPASLKYHCPIGPEFSKVRTDEESQILRRFQ
jgi:deoxycytidine triphosphate deaminase